MLFLKVVLVVSKSQCEWVKNTDAPPTNQLTSKPANQKQRKQQMIVKFITGQIAGGLEAGGTLVMELKDGAGDVIDTAAIDVVE